MHAEIPRCVTSSTRTRRGVTEISKTRVRSKSCARDGRATHTSQMLTIVPNPAGVEGSMIQAAYTDKSGDIMCLGINGGAGETVKAGSKVEFMPCNEAQLWKVPTPGDPRGEQIMLEGVTGMTKQGHVIRFCLGSRMKVTKCIYAPKFFRKAPIIDLE